MRLQDLKQLDAAMETLTACADVDMLFSTLCAHTRGLFRMEAAFIWLSATGEQARLHRTEGVPASMAARLQRLKLAANGERAASRRLHQLGYRSVLAAPLRIQGRVIGMVAVASHRSQRLSRVEAALLHLLVRYAVSVLERWPFPPTVEDDEARRATTRPADLDVQHERSHLLALFISGITHDLNNAMAAISGRVELLLHRLHDQATLPHLESAHRAIIEASHMIRHIHQFMGRDHEDNVGLLDINQLMRDSLQIAQSTWFQGFRQTRVPVDLEADLQAVPPLPGKASDLRIALLCLLRHAMDALRAGGRLLVHTSSPDEGKGRTVVVRFSANISHPSTVASEEGIRLLLKQAQTPESRLALLFVQATMRDMDGRIAVQLCADGGTTTTLTFSVNTMAIREH